MLSALLTAFSSVGLTSNSKCFISYSSPFQGKKNKNGNPEILFVQEKKCPPISVSLENINDINSCDNGDLKVTGCSWC